MSELFKEKFRAYLKNRIAISNNRILKIEDGKVSFLWRDYADNDRVKTMTIDACQFIRRFLLHVLPDGFAKIRYYGLMANRNRNVHIALCREFLGENKIETKNKDAPETWQELLLRSAGVDVTKCTVCKIGRMVQIERLYPLRCNGPPTL
ncbi:MAG: transposase [Nitrospirae bacterium]|nr:transposase [Nitrospirota bacterium]